MGQWVNGSIPIIPFSFSWNEDPFAEAEKGSCESKAAFAMFIDISHISFALSVRCTLDLILPKGPAKRSRTPLVIHSTRLPWILWWGLFDHCFSYSGQWSLTKTQGADASI